MIRHGDTTVRGRVVLASPNGKSLMLGFDTVLGRYGGMMPVLQGDDDIYRALLDDIEIGLSPLPKPS